MNTFFSRLKQRIIDRFTPNAAGLIATVTKMEAKIERTIDKDTRALASLEASRRAIVSTAAVVDADLNAAYKLLHNVSQLTR